MKIRCRQLAIFPGGGPPSIFASMSLYDRVRDGNGCFPHDWSPTNSFIRAVHSKLHSNNKLNAFINLSLCFVFFAPVVLRTCVLALLRHIIVFSLPVLLYASPLRKTPAKPIRKSPRPISIAQLKMLPLLHLRPINRIFCPGTY